MSPEYRGMLSLGLLISSIIIMINAAVSFILGVLVGSFTTGVITLVSHPFSILIFVFLVFAIIGLFIGYNLFRISMGMKVGGYSTNWTFIIILAILAFIFDSGYIIGALIALIVGIGGYVLENNLINLKHYGFGTIGTRICPKCGYVNSGNANFCSSCGNPFLDR